MASIHGQSGTTGQSCAARHFGRWYGAAPLARSRATSANSPATLWAPVCARTDSRYFVGDAKSFVAGSLQCRNRTSLGSNSASRGAQCESDRGPGVFGAASLTRSLMVRGRPRESANVGTVDAAEGCQTSAIWLAKRSCSCGSQPEHRARGLSALTVRRGVKCPLDWRDPPLFEVAETPTPTATATPTDTAPPTASATQTATNTAVPSATATPLEVHDSVLLPIAPLKVTIGASGATVNRVLSHWPSPPALPRRGIGGGRPLAHC